MPDPFELVSDSVSLQVGVKRPSCGTFGKSLGDHRIVL